MTSPALLTTYRNVRDAVANSGIALPLAKAAGDFILPLLNAALPRDPQAYFTLEGTGTP